MLNGSSLGSLLFFVILSPLLKRYCPEFTVNLAEQGNYLPKYVEREFDEYLRYGRLE